MIRRSVTIFLLVAGLILPVWPRDLTTAEAVSNAQAPVDGVCNPASCFEDQVKQRLKCFMPPPANCRDRGCIKPGYAVAILLNNQVVFQGASGFANLKLQQPITNETVFDLASISKQFTAAGILMLIDDPAVKLKSGARLSLETQLSDVLDGFPAATKGTKILDLLTHQSNLPDYLTLYNKKHRGGLERALKKRGPPSWYETMDHRKPCVEVTNEDVLQMIKRARREKREPGADFIYSNSGYVVLAQIIAKLSNKTYKQFMQERIFEPLGMNHTTVFDERSQKIENHAFSYGRANRRYFVFDGYTGINFIHGDGNIHSTLADMIKWIQAIVDVAHGRRETFIKRETLTNAFVNQKLRLDANQDSDYGFGFYVAQKRTVRVIYHGGDWPGFHSHMLYGSIEKDGEKFCELTMIVLSNFEPGQRNRQDRPCNLARELSTLLWGESPDINIILDEDTGMFCGTKRDLRCKRAPGCSASTSN